MSRNSKTRILVEGAMLIALATVLSYLKIFEMPFGGSITLEMLPLVIMGLRRGPKWGCLTGFVHGLLQMIIGFSNVMYCATLISQIGCILLDYLLAFSVLGLAPLFASILKNNKKIGFIVGSACVCILRFLCSFLSGWLLWGSYAPEGMNAAYYSLVYNGAYMLPDTIILAVIVAILAYTVPKIFWAEELAA
ncbi:MAG: energy-coupled thiamine transporter ThiT [Lachnospiraceae bacterium]|nr:energy-coupled thiamine transporter ThiT [Lachnospiraceae bacterium]